MSKFKKVVWFLPVLLVIGLLAGCRTQPIYNVNQVSVQSVIPGHKAVSRNKVKSAITRAAVGLGWQVHDVRPGLIVASLFLRGHVAVVSIPYTSKSYSIHYKSSRNLEHKGNMIHRNYNGWVKNLNRAIMSALSVGA